MPRARHRSVRWLLALLPTWASPAVAATPAQPIAAGGEPAPTGQLSADRPSARRLTLSEALALARRNNRDLRLSRERVREAEADVTLARSALLPRVTAQARYTLNYPEIGLTYVQGSSATTFTLVPQNQLDGYLSATVPLVVPAAYDRLAAARAEQRGHEGRVAASEAQVLRAVATAFYAAASAEGVARVREHAVLVFREGQAATETRFRLGMVNRVELARAELAVLSAEQRQREARDAMSAAYRALAALVGVRGSFQVAASEPDRPDDAAEPAGRAVAEDGEALVETALRRRPEVAASAASLVAAEALARAAAWRLAPSLTATGSLRATNATGFGDQNFYLAGGLQLDWQVFDGLERQGERRGAQARANRARIAVEQTRESVGDDVRGAVERLHTARAGLAVARRSRALAEDALALVRQQHSAGSATQLELLAAQDQFVTAAMGVEQARFALRVEDANLRVVTCDAEGLR